MTMDGAEAAAHVQIPRSADARPYVALNMVESVDGRVTVGDHVGGLTSAEDQELLHRLREQADAVIVGAATVRAEGYGRLLPDEHRRRRVEEGREPEPLLCVLTRLRGLPPESPALGGDHRVLVATGSSGDLLEELPGVEYLRYSTPNQMTPLPRLLEDLRQRFGVRACVCEGGPEVAREFIDTGLCDELFLSISPRIVGFAGRVGVFAPLMHECTLELRSLLRARDHVFLRYGLA
jgi:2,5-diamino-6-(ribosylamino)-4(3H)-pyrimidinone 5'-phosphate reductase